MEDSYARLLKGTKILGIAHNPAELARLLGESDQTIQNWKTRGVPKGKLITIEEKTGLLPTWVVTGRGDMTKISPAGESNLTAEQRQMLSFMIEVDKEDRDILLKIGSILSRNAKAVRNEPVHRQAGEIPQLARRLPKSDTDSTIKRENE